MEYLLVNRVIPYLRKRLGVQGEIRLRVLKTVGLGENRIGELLADFMEKGANPTVGTLAHLGQVDVRIAAKADDAASAERLIAPVETEIRARLADAVFGAAGATLQSEIAARLKAAQGRVALVEVGGAGAASGRLAASAPEAFAGGVVLAGFSEAERLGLDARTVEGSEERTRARAAAVAKWAAAVRAVSWLEPVSGTSPPTGRAIVAVSANGANGEAREYRFGGDLPSMRIWTATLLLDLIRRTLPAEPR
jgi:nicotinamide-nucleotide amidase